jgi:4-alpha-glucanotransferase
MEELYKTLSKDKWKKIGTRPRAGVLVPLFSVHSKDSSGIGDFNDLKLLIDWCEKTCNSVLQLLPMNEVGITFCPYDAISSFALEPAYISLTALAGEGGKSFKSDMAYLKKKFPGGKSHLDYGIREAKNRVLRDLYADKKNQDQGGFKKFIKENSYWIDDFAIFKVLKYFHGGRPWYEWDTVYKDRDPAALKNFQKEHSGEVDFEKWAQWMAYLQFKEAKRYAGSKGVKICGDLPILISRDSADVWAHPGFFRLEFAAGAPPDMYCAKGQRWGTPTYEWDNIAEDNFRYLKAKLKFAENFYDILRVDHVVGLFRIWSIPASDAPENEGLNGSFDPKDESVWKEHGRRILEVMNGSTGMLLSAEDLGVIPKACPETLKEFGIPGNDVQRWTKDWAVKHDFLGPDKYRLLSVSMLSTHDTTNWPAWWEYEAGTVDGALFIRKCVDRGINYRDVIQRLFDPSRSKHGRLRWLEEIDSVDVLVSVLGKREEELKDFIEMYANSYREKEKLWKRLLLKGPMREASGEEIVTAVFSFTLKTGSIFCINTLIDYFYLADIWKGDTYQHRINRPGTISKANWSLVMPLSLEELSKHKVSNKIKSMVKAARF